MLNRYQRLVIIIRHGARLAAFDRFRTSYITSTNDTVPPLNPSNPFSRHISYYFIGCPDHINIIRRRFEKVIYKKKIRF